MSSIIIEDQGDLNLYHFCRDELSSQSITVLEFQVPVMVEARDALRIKYGMTLGYRE